MAAFHTVSHAASGSNLIQYIVGPAIAVLVLGLEVSRRSAKLPQQDAGYSNPCTLESIKKSFGRYVPESLGLVACAVLAIALRVRGSLQMEFSSQLEEEVVSKITNDWPILITADSMLVVQALLRLTVLASTALRKGAGPTLLSQEVTAIFFVAALARTVLVARSSIYMLNGPLALGGYLPAACDLLSVPLLAILTWGIQRKALAASALALAAAACVGYTTSLKLADDAFSDGLFFFVHSAELFAAFAYLSRGVLAEVGLVSVNQESVALQFAHIVMPFQQCLSAYFFVQAFHTVPEMVGGGYPFEILHVGSVAQVAVYACAFVIYLVSCRETRSAAKQQAPYLHTEALIEMP